MPQPRLQPFDRSINNQLGRGRGDWWLHPPRSGDDECVSSLSYPPLGSLRRPLLRLRLPRSPTTTATRATSRSQTRCCNCPVDGTDFRIVARTRGRHARGAFFLAAERPWEPWIPRPLVDVCRNPIGPPRSLESALWESGGRHISIEAAPHQSQQQQAHAFDGRRIHTAHTGLGRRSMQRRRRRLHPSSLNQARRAAGRRPLLLGR